MSNNNSAFIFVLSIEELLKERSCSCIWWFSETFDYVHMITGLRSARVSKIIFKRFMMMGCPATVGLTTWRIMRYMETH